MVRCFGLSKIGAREFRKIPRRTTRSAYKVPDLARFPLPDCTTTSRFQSNLSTAYSPCYYSPSVRLPHNDHGALNPGPRAHLECNGDSRKSINETGTVGERHQARRRGHPGTTRRLDCKHYSRREGDRRATSSKWQKRKHEYTRQWLIC